MPSMVYLFFFSLRVFFISFPLENANTEEKDKFDEAFSQVCDPLIPVRGHGLLQLASLLRQRNTKAVQATDTLLKIFLEQLSHDDSYIYLAAIQGLVSLADVRADTVMPQLAREFVACRKDAGITAGSTKEANDKGYYKPGDITKLCLISRLSPVRA